MTEQKPTAPKRPQKPSQGPRAPKRTGRHPLRMVAATEPAPAGVIVSGITRQQRQTIVMTISALPMGLRAQSPGPSAWD